MAGNHRDLSQTGSAARTSQSLLAGMRDADPASWRRMVTLYSPLVYHWCRRMGLSEQDMADVFQDVFGSVASHIGNFRSDRPGDTFRGWLRTITRNKVLDHFRRQARQPQATGGTEAQMRLSQVRDEQYGSASDLDDHGPVAEQAAYGHLYHRALELIQCHFEPRTWQAFWRVVVDGKTPAEVGQELSMRPGTVRVAKSRVLRRLRLELGDRCE